MNTTETKPTEQPTLIITKADCEGTIRINALDGRVVQDEANPEWSEGLAVAMLAERIGYYEGRLGKAAAGEILGADTIAFEDLGWLGVDNEQNEVTVDADAEHRMGVIAKAMGVDLEGALEQDGLKGLAEAEIAMDAHRTGAEAADLDQATKDAFIGGNTEAEAERKTVNA